MKQGTKVELPLWLGEMLAVRCIIPLLLVHSAVALTRCQTNSQTLNTSALVTLDLPAALSQRVMNALKADPRTLDLRAQATHFYNLGARILELFEEEEMVEVLTEVRRISVIPMT